MPNPRLHRSGHAPAGRPVSETAGCGISSTWQRAPHGGTGGKAAAGPTATGPDETERVAALLTHSQRPRSTVRSTAPSAGHRPRRAGRIKGGAVRGPLNPTQHRRSAMPSGHP